LVRKVLLKWRPHALPDQTGGGGQTPIKSEPQAQSASGPANGTTLQSDNPAAGHPQTIQFQNPGFKGAGSTLEQNQTQQQIKQERMDIQGEAS
jgi:hypothetical protein